MLSYDAVKIIALVVGVCALWSLVFTLTAAKTTSGQSFCVFIGTSVSSEPTNDLLSEMQDNGAFSYNILDAYTRLSDEQYYTTLLSSYAMTGELDVAVVTNVAKEENTSSEFATLVDGYEAYEIFLLLDDCEAYLRNFGTNATKSNADIRTVEFDREKIALNFRTMSKGDNRYRTEEQILSGIEQEIVRINDLRKALISVNGVIAAHPELLTYYKRSEESGSPDDVAKAYGIDVSKIKGGKKDIVSLWNNGNDAQNIVLVFFDMESFQPDMQYECVSFLNYIFSVYGNYN